MIEDKYDVSKEFFLKDAPEGMNELMINLFNYDSHARPTFQECLTRLRKIEKELEDPKFNKWKNDLSDSNDENTAHVVVDTGYKDGDYEVEEENGTKKKEYDQQVNEENK